MRAVKDSITACLIVANIWDQTQELSIICMTEHHGPAKDNHIMGSSTYMVQRQKHLV